MPHESQFAITLNITLWNKRTQPELNYFVKFANQLDLRLDEEGWATLRATSQPHTHKKGTGWSRNSFHIYQERTPAKQRPVDAIRCWSAELIPPVNDVLICLLFFFLSTHRAPERQNKRGEVSEDKVTYPLDEEGDNLNSYGGRGGKKEKIRGFLDAETQPNNFSARKEVERSRRRARKGAKRAKKFTEDGEKSFCASGSPSILRCEYKSERHRRSARERERERARERERLRVCVSEAHWIRSSGCWSAPPPLRFTLRRGRRKQEDARVMSAVM